MSKNSIDLMAMARGECDTPNDLAPMNTEATAEPLANKLTPSPQLCQGLGSIACAGCPMLRLCQERQAFLKEQQDTAPSADLPASEPSWTPPELTGVEQPLSDGYLGALLADDDRLIVAMPSVPRPAIQEYSRSETTDPYTPGYSLFTPREVEKTPAPTRAATKPVSPLHSATRAFSTAVSSATDRSAVPDRSPWLAYRFFDRRHSSSSEASRSSLRMATQETREGLVGINITDPVNTAQIVADSHPADTQPHNVIALDTAAVTSVPYSQHSLERQNEPLPQNPLRPHLFSQSAVATTPPPDQYAPQQPVINLQPLQRSHEVAATEESVLQAINKPILADTPDTAGLQPSLLSHTMTPPQPRTTPQPREELSDNYTTHDIEDRQVQSTDSPIEATHSLTPPPPQPTWVARTASQYNKLFDQSIRQASPVVVDSTTSSRADQSVAVAGQVSPTSKATHTAQQVPPASMKQPFVFDSIQPADTQKTQPVLTEKNITKQSVKITTKQSYQSTTFEQILPATPPRQRSIAADHYEASQPAVATPEQGSLPSDNHTLPSQQLTSSSLSVIPPMPQLVYQAEVLPPTDEAIAHIQPAPPHSSVIQETYSSDDISYDESQLPVSHSDNQVSPDYLGSEQEVAQSVWRADQVKSSLVEEIVEEIEIAPLPDDSDQVMSGSSPYDQRPPESPLANTQAGGFWGLMNRLVGVVAVCVAMRQRQYRRRA